LAGLIRTISKISHHPSCDGVISQTDPVYKEMIS